MNPRERKMLVVLLGIVTLAGGYFLVKLAYLDPLKKRDVRLLRLRDEVETKQEQLLLLEADKNRLAAWRLMSLPVDADPEQFSATRHAYAEYLRGLIRQSGLSADAVRILAQMPDARNSPTLANKKPAYVRLAFTIEQLRGNLAGVVKLLEGFSRTGLLHQVKQVNVQRPLTGSNRRQDELDVKMTIEALILEDTSKRTLLGPEPGLLLANVVSTHWGGPAGLLLVPWAAGPASPQGPGRLAAQARQYDVIAKRNVFFGPPAPVVVERTASTDVDVSPYVFLTDVTRIEQRVEASLYDRYHNRKYRVMVSAGFNTFPIRKDQEGNTLVRGRIDRINDRDLIFHKETCTDRRSFTFRVEDRYYVIRLGQNLEHAQQRSLREGELREYGLAKARQEPTSSAR